MHARGFAIIGSVTGALFVAALLTAAGVEAQAHQVFLNMRAVAEAAGGSLDNIAKVTIFLADLSDFTKVNEIMQSYFRPPYPARATVEVSGMPRGARIEVEGILAIA